MQTVKYEYASEDDFYQLFEWSDGNGNEYDFTNCSASLDLKHLGETVLEFRVSPTGTQGTVTMGGAAGTITLSCTKEIVNGALDNGAVGDLVAVWADGRDEAQFCIQVVPHTCQEAN